MEAVNLEIRVNKIKVKLYCCMVVKELYAAMKLISKFENVYTPIRECQFLTAPQIYRSREAHVS